MREALIAPRSKIYVKSAHEGRQGNRVAIKKRCGPYRNGSFYIMFHVLKNERARGD